jgi:hypothetical protein
VFVAQFLRTGCELVLEAKRQVGRDLLGVRAEKRQLTNRVPVMSRDDNVGNSVVAALQKMREIAGFQRTSCFGSLILWMKAR